MIVRKDYEKKAEEMSGMKDCVPLPLSCLFGTLSIKNVHYGF